MLMHPIHTFILMIFPFFLSNEYCEQVRDKCLNSLNFTLAVIFDLVCISKNRKLNKIMVTVVEEERHGKV